MRGKDLRIVFFGTPDFAVASLDALVSYGYNVVGVVTATDKPAGRGHKIIFSPVKNYALEHNIPLLQPQRLKSEEFLKELCALKADLQVVVAFRMLPKEVYSMPKYGTFNLHASLLPKYRGAAPIHWAVINGEKESGLTTFLLNDKIDEGEIIFQHKMPISEHETTGELHDRMMQEGRELVVKTVQAISEGNYTPISQESLNTEYSIAPKLFKDTANIPWQKKSEEIVNFIRGMSPFPGANMTVIGLNTNVEMSFKVFRAKYIGLNNIKNIGAVQFNLKEGVVVNCIDGQVQLLDLQLNGKKRMNAEDFLRGFKAEDEFVVKK